MGTVLASVDATIIRKIACTSVPRDLVILGSGLNSSEILDQHLASDWKDHEVAFDSLDIHVPSKGGHPGTFVLSKWAGRDVVVSRGRVHKFQVPVNPRMLRKWMATAFALMHGGRRIIVTNAVGGLHPGMEEASIALPTQVIGYHFQGDGYVDGTTDGHPASESVLPQLSSPFNREASRFAKEANLWVSSDHARYIAVNGPRFGGAGERFLFGDVYKCDTVGMSLLPELDLVAVENMGREPEQRLKLGSMQIVSDNKDHPSDAEVVDVVARVAPKVATVISNLLASTEW